MEVIAEGVETAAQVKFLHEHGCHGAQGFHFSRSVPAAEFLALLAHDTAKTRAAPALASVRTSNGRTKTSKKKRRTNRR